MNFEKKEDVYYNFKRELRDLRHSMDIMANSTTTNDLKKGLDALKDRIDLIAARNRGSGPFGGMLLKLFSLLIFLGLISQSAMFMFNNKPLAPVPQVAVVDVEGFINNNLAFYDNLNQQINMAFFDPNTTQVIIRFNSPGGFVAASWALYQKILENKKITGKKVYAFIQGECCSGAYAMALACDAIYSSPGSIIGSIGIKRELISFKKLADKLGIEKVSESSDVNKIGPSPFSSREEINDYFAQEWSRKYLDDVFQSFKDLVREHRGEMFNDKDNLIFTGATFGPEVAYQYGLIDGVIFFDQLIKKHCSTDKVLFCMGGRNRITKSFFYDDKLQLTNLLETPFNIPITIDVKSD